MKKEEVLKLLEKHGLTWEQFDSWMIGQTVSGDKDGNTIYYTHDVKRFINSEVNGIDTYFD